MKKLYYLIFFFVSLLVAGACSKGRELKQEEFIDLTFQNLTIDPVNVQVFVNGSAQYPYVGTGASWRQRVGFSDSPTMHFNLEQVPSRNMLVDLSYQPGIGRKTRHFFTWYQPRTGTTPFLVLPPANEAYPAPKHTKVQFTYRDANLPDSIKFRFYYSRSLLVKDSCMVGRYGFSNWGDIQLPLSIDSALEFDIVNGATNASLAFRRRFPISQYDIPIDDFMILSYSKDQYGDPVLTRYY